MHVVCGLGHPQSKIMASPRCVARNLQWGAVLEAGKTSNDLDPGFDWSSLILSRFP